MKLSKRLQTILNMVEAPYDHIWDTCCDHGQLGRALIAQSQRAHIHFVDVMPHLITSIHDELNHDVTLSDSHKWSTHAMDCGQITLQKGQSHLVIIAGVGGDLLLKLVKEIIGRNHNANIDFILCPIRQLHKVRHGLKQLELNLLSETLLKEFAHYYEILHVSNHKPGSKVSPIGESMWNLNRAVDQEYLNKNLKHYGNMCKQAPNEFNGENSPQTIYHLYKALQQKSQN